MEPKLGETKRPELVSQRGPVRHMPPTSTTRVEARCTPRVHTSPVRLLPPFYSIAGPPYLPPPSPPLTVFVREAFFWRDESILRTFLSEGLRVRTGLPEAMR